jgi:anti-sigma factor RsiW
MSTAREDLELNLAFHVNGTLSPEEQAEIDAWLTADDEARAEAEGLAAIRADMQAEDIRSPGEFGLARLMRDVAREQAAVAAAPAPAPVLRRPWVWQAVAAVALAAFLGQTWVAHERGAELRYGLTNGVDATARFGLASGGEAPGAAASAPVLVVAFAPTATEAQIRDLLLQAGVEIVAGPSALGLYRLAGDDLTSAQAMLEGAGIVESVQSGGN